MKVAPFSVHLAYTTYPNENERDFVDSKVRIFQSYIDKSEKYLSGEFDSILYKPLVYHLFGSFDVVFISLIDNYKFCQKIFNLDTNSSGRPINFQIVTGSCFEEYTGKKGLESLPELFPISNTDSCEGQKFYKYTHITNFKINNGILIGVGLEIIKSVSELISQQIDDEDQYLIANSFNWSELTLIQLGDDLNRLQLNIIKLRELTLAHLKLDKNLVKKTLYYRLYIDEHFDNPPPLTSYNQNDILHSHIFVDTHSYSGVDYYQFNSNFEPGLNPFANDDFKSSIELQVKPGHFLSLSKVLLNQSHEVLDKEEVKETNLFDLSKMKFKNGKTDYILKESNHQSFYSNYSINKEIKKVDSEYYRHIRKVKTNYLYDIGEGKEIKEFLDEKEKTKVKGYSDGITTFGKYLGRNYILEDEKLKKSLKSLGISRHLREKVLKAVYNYNSIIQDVILCNEFIELREFLSFVIRDVNSKADIIDSYFINVFDALEKYRSELDPFCINELEEKWLKLLDNFEEAYNNRVHNNYLYEDINEFSIDFNSAINQINTIQDFTVKTFNNTFFHGIYKDNVIVTQNEIESLSNIVNVNYNVYHYLEPSLIFASLLKEVFNQFESKTKGFEKGYFLNIGDQTLSEIGAVNLSLRSEVKLEDFDFWYFFADLAKFSCTFLFDYDLYYHWTWTYFLQNSNVYTALGLPDERLFNQELLRVCLVKKLFTEDSEYVQNPVPELFHYWQKNIRDIDELAEKIINTSVVKLEIKKFLNFLFKFLSEANSIEVMRCIQKQDFVKSDNSNIRRGIHKVWNILEDEPFDTAVVCEKCEDQFKFILAKSIAYRKRLEKGLVVIDEKLPLTESKTFYFISAIGHATLVILRDEMSCKLSLLRRNWDTGEPNRDFVEIEKSDLMIDSCGGYFTKNLPSREFQFGLKNAVIQSLWDRVLKDKVRLFKSTK